MVVLVVSVDAPHEATHVAIVRLRLITFT